MKIFTAILLFLAFHLQAFSQSKELSYEIRKTYRKAIEKEALYVAQTMKDINPDFPDGWIADADYVSSKISISGIGESEHAMGANQILNKEQRCVLKKADIGSDIEVEIKYNAKNIVTQKVEVNTMKFKVSVIPEADAEYPGGEEELKKYVKKMAVDKISSIPNEKLELVIARFIIDEEGKTLNPHITKTSGIKDVDELLLKSISNMPAWKSAIAPDGNAVKQIFEIHIGRNVGC